MVMYWENLSTEVYKYFAIKFSAKRNKTGNSSSSTTNTNHLCTSDSDCNHTLYSENALRISSINL